MKIKKSKNKYLYSLIIFNFSIHKGTKNQNKYSC